MVNSTDKPKKAMVAYSGRRERLTAGHVIMVSILTLFCFTMLYPFYNLLIQSFSKASDVIAANGLMLIPRSIQLDAYEYMFRYPYLWESYRNTVTITVCGTAINMLMTTLGAYVLARRDLPGRSVLTTIVVITMFVSGGMIPGYLNMRDLGLLNSLWALMLPGAISTWNMLLMRNFIMGIPQDLTEAARIDGAGELRLVVSIILPLSMPIIATLTLFYGVGHWNAYSNVIIYNSRPNLQTNQVIIRRMYETATMDLEETITPPMDAIRAATVMFSTVPILCVYPFLQKYFAQGLMVGSVKG